MPSPDNPTYPKPHSYPEQRQYSRGSLVLELPLPVQVADGRWLVAVWINAHRPDTTPAKAAPIYVLDLDQWVPSADAPLSEI